MLKSQYKSHLGAPSSNNAGSSGGGGSGAGDSEGGLAAGTWNEALEQIGEMYFGIKIPSQRNPLLDMVGSMFMGGGGGGGGGAGEAAKRLGQGRGGMGTPPAAGLD